MIVTSTDAVPGSDVVEVLGLSRGNTVRARNIGRDITQRFRNLAGGELKAYSSLLSEARDEALTRMEAEALELGADAIVNVRFETAQVTGGRCRDPRVRDGRSARVMAVVFAAGSVAKARRRPTR